MESKKGSETEYTVTPTIPFIDGSVTQHNSSNVNKVSDKYGVGNLSEFSLDNNNEL